MAKRIPLRACLVASIAVFGSLARAQDTQSAVMAPVGTIVLRVHAVGAQIYECKANAAGTPVWTFREPIASLMSEGRTVGRHFAGPAWEMADGSRIVGTVVAKAAGTSSGDIPWLKLAVADRQGDGVLSAVSTVQRINTAGGNKSGACADAGTLISEPYAADYSSRGNDGIDNNPHKVAGRPIAARSCR